MMTTQSDLDAAIRGQREFSVLSVSEEKFQENRFAPQPFRGPRVGEWIHWVKVETAYGKPLLFKISRDEQEKLSLKSGDIITLTFGPRARFSEKEDVIFTNHAEHIDFVMAETVKLEDMTFALCDVTFMENRLRAKREFGHPEEVTMPSGFVFNNARRGDLFKVQTRKPTLGARTVEVDIDGELWAKYQPDFDLSWSHNKVKGSLTDAQKMEPFIEVSGEFSVTYRGDDTVILRSTGNIVVTRFNTVNMKRAVAESELADRWRGIRSKLRDILHLKHILSLEDARKIMEEGGWTGNNVEEAVKSITWGKTYNHAYFDYLKSLTGNVVYFTEDGYFFKVNDFTIFEVPKHGLASYLFRGEPSEIVAKLGRSRDNTAQSDDILESQRGDDYTVFDKGGMLSRSELLEMKKEFPEAAHFFIGRVIHTDFEQWSQKLGEKMA